MTTITEYLQEQKRLAEAATPGKWEAVSARYGYDVSETWAVEPAGPSVHNVCHVTTGEADAAFIAAARSSVPRLVAALEAVVDLIETTPDDGCCESCEGYSGAMRDVKQRLEAELGGEGE